MSRKSAFLLSLLNLVVKSIAGQMEALSNQLVALPPHPPADDREAWRAYWQAQGQPWRTEPEIDNERQVYLAGRRSISPDIEHGIYPFKGVKLNRADVEWLLATHENGRGPVDWSDEKQHNRWGLDLRGADLCEVNIGYLPLTRLRGGLNANEWHLAPPEHHEAAVLHLEGAKCVGVRLQGAELGWAHLEKALLNGAYLEATSLRLAHLEGTDLTEAHLKGANLRGTFFDSATDLDRAILSSTLVSSTHWNDANLAVVKWSQVHTLGDEAVAWQAKGPEGKKDKRTRLEEFERAVRANRRLTVVLRDHGLNEDATRFAYRAQVLQKTVFQLQMFQPYVKLKQRARTLGAWLFSWFLFLLAGYGYRLWRSFLTYALVIIGFTAIYYVLGASFKSPLSLVNALGLSMTSFHGRGFFPGITQLNDTLTILASLEAFVGLILEATFIATLTQRFFGK